MIEEVGGTHQVIVQVSQRYQYQNHCGRKHGHKNEGAAWSHIKSLWNNKKQDTTDMRAYRCLYCDLWHVGHKQKAA